MDTKQPGSIALRRGRRSIPGQIYSVTAATRWRRAHFVDVGTAQTAATVLNDRLTWPAAIPLLWLLMPDHLHLMLELRADESLSVCISRVKALIARRIPIIADGRLWQPSFHDHALRRQENVLHVARYILLNPVRAGLVDRHEEWSWRGGTLVQSVIEELPWMG